MKTVEEFREALTAKQRIARKQSFKKNKAKIMRGREKAAKKKATPEKLKARAEAGARKALENKLLKGKSKSDLSFAEKEKLEKKLKKKGGAIKRIAKKMLPGVRKKDAAKLQKKTEESTINEAKSSSRAIYIMTGNIQVGNARSDDSVKIKPAVEKDLWDWVEENNYITIEDIKFFVGDTDDETMLHMIGHGKADISEWQKFTKSLEKFDRRIELERYL